MSPFNLYYRGSLAFLQGLSYLWHPKPPSMKHVKCGGPRGLSLIYKWALHVLQWCSNTKTAAVELEEDGEGWWGQYLQYLRLDAWRCLHEGIGTIILLITPEGSEAARQVVFVMYEQGDHTACNLVIVMFHSLCSHQLKKETKPVWETEKLQISRRQKIYHLSCELWCE